VERLPRLSTRPAKAAQVSALGESCTFLDPAQVVEVAVPSDHFAGLRRCEIHRLIRGSWGSTSNPGSRAMRAGRPGNISPMAFGSRPTRGRVRPPRTILAGEKKGPKLRTVAGQRMSEAPRQQPVAVELEGAEPVRDRPAVGTRAVPHAGGTRAPGPDHPDNWATSWRSTSFRLPAASRRLFGRRGRQKIE